MVVGAQLALEVVMDGLAGLGIAADQQWRQHLALGPRRRRADPVGDIFAAEPVIAADHHGIAVEAGLAALDIGEVADALRLLPDEAEILDLEPEAVDLDAIDLAHAFPRIGSCFDKLSMR